MSIQCYNCDAIHDGPLTDEELIRDDPDDWGWMWGSDGIAPDGASAMYACSDCKEDMCP